jgi:hypothetical protein
MHKLFSVLVFSSMLLLSVPNAYSGKRINFVETPAYEFLGGQSDVEIVSNHDKDAPWAYRFPRSGFRRIPAFDHLLSSEQHKSAQVQMNVFSPVTLNAIVNYAFLGEMGDVSFPHIENLLIAIEHFHDAGMETQLNKLLEKKISRASLKNLPDLRDLLSLSARFRGLEPLKGNIFSRIQAVLSSEAIHAKKSPKEIHDILMNPNSGYIEKQDHQKLAAIASDYFSGADLKSVCLNRCEVRVKELSETLVKHIRGVILNTSDPFTSKIVLATPTISNLWGENFELWGDNFLASGTIQYSASTTQLVTAMNQAFSQFPDFKFTPYCSDGRKLESYRFQCSVTRFEISWM